MPLLAPTLIDALIKMDEPEPPKTPEATAEAWYQAWWAHAQQMSYWTPGMLPLIEEVVKPLFIAALLPGCIPNPIPGVFYLALELAATAAWVAALNTPGFLLPAVAPPALPPPIPGALVVALVATVPVGLASPSKEPVRIAIATALDLWTHLFTVTLVPPPPPPAPPLAPLL
jgi:hypothetical protein